MQRTETPDELTLTTKHIESFYTLVVELGSNISSEKSEEFKEIANDYLCYLKNVVASKSQDKQKLKELGDRIQKEEDFLTGKINFAILEMIVKDISQDGIALKAYLNANPLLNTNMFIEQLDFLKKAKLAQQDVNFALRTGKNSEVVSTHTLFSQPKEEVKDFKDKLRILKRDIRVAYNNAYKKNQEQNYLSAINYCELAIARIEGEPSFLENSDIQNELSILQSFLAVTATNQSRYLLHNNPLQLNHVAEAIYYLRHATTILENKQQNENDKLNLILFKRELAASLNVYANTLQGVPGAAKTNDELITKCYKEALQILETISPATTIDLVNRFQIQENFAKYIYTSGDASAKEESMKAKKLLEDLESFKEKIQPKYDLAAAKLRIAMLLHLSEVGPKPIMIKLNIKLALEENLAAMTLLEKNFFRLDLDPNAVFNLSKLIKMKLFKYAEIAKDIGCRQTNPKDAITYINQALECFKFIDDREFIGDDDDNREFLKQIESPFLKDELLVLKQIFQAKLALEDNNTDKALDELIDAIHLANDNTKKHDLAILKLTVAILTHEEASLRSKGEFAEALQMLDISIDKINTDIKNKKFKKWLNTECLVLKKLCEGQIAAQENKFDTALNEIFSALNLPSHTQIYTGTALKYAKKFLVFAINSDIEQGQDPIIAVVQVIEKVESDITNEKIKTLLKTELLQLKKVFHEEMLQSRKEEGPSQRSMYKGS